MVGKNPTALERAQQIFIDRLPEQVQAAIEAWEDWPENAAAAIDKVYLLAHTLKGSGATLGIWDLVQPATEIAAVMHLLKDYRCGLEDAIKLFVHDRLKMMSRAPVAPPLSLDRFPAVASAQAGWLRRIL